MEKEWFSLITASIENGQRKISDYSLEYLIGVTSEEVENAEIRLGFKIPEDLKSLLMEFNGVHEYALTDKGERIPVGSIIWNLSSVVERHLSVTVPMKSKLFCFGGAVLGNCFGYLIVDDRPDENQIWQSDHETEFPDEQIVWRAASLREFITTSLVESRWY